MRLDRLGNREVTHAGLDHRATRQRVDIENAAHLGEAQHYALGVRQRAARQAGAGAAADHRQALLVAHAHDLLHLLGAFRQQHQ